MFALIRLLSLGLLALEFFVGRADAHGHLDHYREEGHQHDHQDHHRRLQETGRLCGTKDISGEEMARVEAELQACEIKPNNAEQTANIQVVWHSIRRSSGSNGITDAMITNSVGVLNSAFSSAGFAFTLVAITTTDNDSYYSASLGSAAETAMKSLLRQGDQATLNIYSTGIDQVSGILGWATFPSSYSTDPTDDGVVIGTQTAPGGTNSPYNLGDTLVHEVGHWLFLYHVFQGGCSGNGDFVADTPPQSTATSGCPANQDSCSGGGVDSVTNYMDYSTDACMFQFTAGQISRMTTAWNTYRTGGTPLPTDPNLPAPSSPTSPGNAPTVAPTEAPSICFSATATIPVQNQGPIEMPNLTHGDKVLTASGYHTLYGFGHQDSQTETEYLQIHTQEYSSKPLEISRDHLLFVVGKSHAVPAKSIKPGDLLLSNQWPDGVEVTKITTIYRNGLYAPVTTDGTVVVDGIVCSCYVALQRNAGEFVELKGGYSIGLSQHFAAHLSLTPVRLACMGISANLCKSYDRDGLAHFAKIGFAACRWADNLSFSNQFILMPLYLGGLFALYGLECLLGPKLSAWVTFAVLVALFGACVHGAKGLQSKKKKLD